MKLENPMPLPNGQPWLEPWTPFVPGEEHTQTAFEKELRLELAPQHAIFEHAASAKAVAHIPACDDVLFWLPASKMPFAIVHLTWRGKAEENPSYPTTNLIGSIEEFIAKHMLPAHEDWL